jgi:hypothetical protein
MAHFRAFAVGAFRLDLRPVADPDLLDMGSDRLISFRLGASRKVD